VTWLPWVVGGGVGIAGAIAALVFRIQLERTRTSLARASARAHAADADRLALAGELAAAQSAAAEGRARLSAQIEELHAVNRVLSDGLAEVAAHDPTAARVHRRSVFERARAKTAGSGPHTAVQDPPGAAVPGRGDRGDRG
jgi:hypothetical protein